MCCRMTLLGIWVMFSSQFYWGDGCWEDGRGKLLLLSDPMKGLQHRHDLSLLALTLITQRMPRLSEFSAEKSVLLPFLYRAAWMETCDSKHPLGGNYAPAHAAELLHKVLGVLHRTFALLFCFLL